MRRHDPNTIAAGDTNCYFHFGRRMAIILRQRPREPKAFSKNENWLDGMAHLGAVRGLLPVRLRMRPTHYQDNTDQRECGWPQHCRFPLFLSFRSVPSFRLLLAAELVVE